MQHTPLPASSSPHPHPHHPPFFLFFFTTYIMCMLCMCMYVRYIILVITVHYIFNILKIIKKSRKKGMVFKQSFKCFKNEQINFIQALLKLETLLFQNMFILAHHILYWYSDFDSNKKKSGPKTCQLTPRYVIALKSYYYYYYKFCFKNHNCHYITITIN